LYFLVTNAHHHATQHKGATENAGLENDEPSKAGGWKMQDWKMQDRKMHDWKMQNWKMQNRKMQDKPF